MRPHKRFGRGHLAIQASAIASGLFTVGMGQAQAQGLAWLQRPVNSPVARAYHAMAFDSARHVVVLFGGDHAGTSLGDTWEWDGQSWLQRLPLASPAAREDHALVYDPSRRRTLLYGGHGATSYFAETWEWDGTTWNQRFPLSSPSVMVDPAMVFDTARQRVVLTGAFLLNDALQTWEWDGVTWLQRIVSPSPPPRRGQAMSFDSIRQVTVLFGGSSPNGDNLNDTWEWDGTTWLLRTPAVTPSVRHNHAMTYEEARQRTVLFGGANNSVGLLEDTWEWDGTSWVQQAAVGPSPRAFHALAHDSTRGFTVLLGGSDFPIETWELGVPCPLGPSVEMSPSSQTTCPTGSAPFAVAAQGSMPLTYQWQVQTPLGSWLNLSGDSISLPCGVGVIAYAVPTGSPSVRIAIRPCPGNPVVPQHLQIRCIVADACGTSISSGQATYTICRADFDCSGAVNLSDIFEFLTGWFAGDPNADVNESNGLTIADIFAFLDSWFAGCS